MNIEPLRRICLGFPCVTERVQWGNHLLFEVGGKMFAITSLEPAPSYVTFKCTPDSFAELVERQNIIPAPYLARAYWVALQTNDALSQRELVDCLRAAYDLILAKLPRKKRDSLASGKPAPQHPQKSSAPRRKSTPSSRKRKTRSRSRR
jgi:predicted DNA-binding protein (MmcQ/YjbR family)